MKLTEEDVKFQFITPSIESSGWQKEQFRMEYFFTDGQVIVRGNHHKRGKRKKADYVLFRENSRIPIALIEAKTLDHSVGSGMQQALDYAKVLDIPFVYSSNGKGFLEHDRLKGTEKEISLQEFPTEFDLVDRYNKSKNFTQADNDIINEPFYMDLFAPKTPRYYQTVAVQRTVEAIVKGQKRLLLVMATGTGKTYTAFQIIWKLIKTNKIKKVLYLADRNILIDQSMQQDFKPFSNVMTKIKDRHLDSAYEIYMSLYHQLAGEEGIEPFRELAPDFFDLIIVDEAHRGSAKEDSIWRAILDYFKSAIQIGMTATPKETKYISNINYFGDPVYTYSLKQGINDGFLAPYKVVRINIDRDSEGWRPYLGQKDLTGQLIEDREYDSKDFDRKLVIDERTQEVAGRITKWLKENDRFSKTIVFCVDIDHAERMRQALINENTDLILDNSNYIMRITGDNPEGKAKLDYFIDVNEKYPSVVTTSKLMTTGVDAKTTKLIVLDNTINSMTEFKQIIGRGTRLLEKYGKYYFTIMDFRNASRLFADPEFDGEPIEVFEGQMETPEDETNPIVDPVDVETEENIKYRVSGVSVQIINERVQYYDIDGKLITESIIDYSRKNFLSQYATLDDFINNWSSADKKTAIVEELEQRGVFIQELRSEYDNDIDDFDLILHFAFDVKPLTKKERVKYLKNSGFLDEYSETCVQVLNALLDKYQDEGIREIEDTRTLENDPFDKIGNPSKIASYFGGKDKYIQTVREVSNILYSVKGA